LRLIAVSETRTAECQANYSGSSAASLGGTLETDR